MDNSTKHIPFAVIVAATIGDEAAIQKILDFSVSYTHLTLPTILRV